MRPMTFYRVFILLLRRFLPENGINSRSSLLRLSGMFAFQNLILGKSMKVVGSM